MYIILVGTGSFVNSYVLIQKVNIITVCSRAVLDRTSCGTICEAKTDETSSKS